MKLVSACLSLWLGVGAAIAATDAEIERYWQLADLDQYVEQTVEESLVWGKQLDDYYLAGRGGVAWSEALDQIFEQDRIAQLLRKELHAELASVDLATTLALLESDVGQRIVPLEHAAREALVDWDTWDAAQRMASGINAILPRREQLFGRLLVAGDYFELVVASTLEGHRIFLRAATKDGKFGGIMSEDELMAWLEAEEGATRWGLYDWMNAFYFIAYHDLGDDEIQQIVDYAEHPHTIAFTAAALRAFNAVSHQTLAEAGAALAKALEEIPL